MKSTFFIMCLALCLFTACGTQNQDNKQPNIVIIYADDMGYGDLACQNPNSKIPTPNLDKLASEGMRFTDGHSSSGICSPSRFALLTGTYHWRRQHGIIQSMGTPDFFRPNDITLANMLKEKGYATAAIGKWHLGFDWPSILTEAGKKVKKPIQIEHYDWTKTVSGGPCSRGFDSYFGDGTINFPPYLWMENDEISQIPTEMVSREDYKAKEGNMEFRPGPRVAGWDPYDVLPTLGKRAVELVKNQSKDQPFFLYFALPSPHAPIIPNDEYDGKSQAGPYGDFVFQTDEIIGNVLNALKEKGLDENTLVIFTADNGPEKYAFDRIKNYNHYSMGQLRGLKRDTWEGGHRVPFVVKWPGKIEKNTVSDITINQVDIMSTLASIVGYSIPNHAAVDSYDFLKVWTGKQKTPVREATVQNTFKDQYVLRKGDWALVDSYSGEHSGAPMWFYEESGYPKLKKGDNEGLLFNVKEDLSQHKNVYADYPEKVKEMKALLKKYRTEGRSVPVRQ